MVAIFGQNLAAGARSLAASDLVNGNLPTSLGGITVSIDNQPAFLYYVSPAGLLQQLRADCRDSRGTAKSGDVRELYGTAFGPTSPVVPPGTVFSGSASTTHPVTVTIGGSPAVVSYAGLVGAGLYQINVTVPSLTDGTYPVLASVAGSSTQSGVSLKVQS